MTRPLPLREHVGLVGVTFTIIGYTILVAMLVAPADRTGTGYAAALTALVWAGGSFAAYKRMGQP